ncbi:MAG: hypothetical protein GC172_13100 [Phycisphaera sp.]|nr:hypothetical protein [Phycisphaera sp.]
MSNNRHARNPQQLRALIQNMGRSIEEARQRRMGPEQGPDSGAAATGARSDAASQPHSAHAGSSGSSHPSASSPASPSATNHPPAPHQMPPASPPPIRSATEMFSESAPRLKARPKRAS